MALIGGRGLFRMDKTSVTTHTHVCVRVSSLRVSVYRRAALLYKRTPGEGGVVTVELFICPHWKLESKFF